MMHAEPPNVKPQSTVMAWLFAGYLVTVGAVSNNALTYGMAGVLLVLTFGRMVVLGRHRGMPLSVFLALSWVVLSASWSTMPTDTLVKSVVCVGITALIYWAVAVIGVSRVTARLRWVFAALVALQYGVVFAANAGVHSSDNPFLAGAWHGSFAHKNEAGAFAAVAVIWYAWSCVAHRRLTDAFGLIAAGVLLHHTHSLTSGALVFVGLLALAFVSAGGANLLVKAIKLLCLVALAVAIAVAISNPDIQARLFSDPLALTGRIGLWKAAFWYWLDNPVLGAGFRGVFNNTLIDLNSYAETAYSFVAPHPHNAYLDLLAGTGLVGAILCVWAFVLLPVVTLIRLPQARFADPVTCFAGIFVFLALRASFEGNILQFDNAGWLYFALSTAAIADAGRSARECSYA